MANGNDQNTRQGPGRDEPSEGRVTLRGFLGTLSPTQREVCYWFMRVAFFGFATAMAMLLRNNSYLPLVIAFVGVAMVAAGLELWLRRGRKSREVLRCGKCGEDLSKLPAVGECPRCGVRYEIVTDRVVDDE